MTSQPNPVDDQSMRALTDELAHLVLNEVAPEELALCQMVRCLRHPRRGRREAGLVLGLDSL